jgi:hypothetical protein
LPSQIRCRIHASEHLISQGFEVYGAAFENRFLGFRYIVAHQTPPGFEPSARNLEKAALESNPPPGYQRKVPG